VRKRWILHEPIENDDVLSASELGPVADTTSMYESVEKMRTVPFGRRALLMVLAPIAIPMIIAASTQIPIKDLL
jgi:hypothetical protein